MWIDDYLRLDNKIGIFLKHHAESGLPLFLYGNGKAARFFVDFMRANLIRIEGIIDANATEKKTAYGIPITTLDETIRNYEQADVVVSAPAYAGEITRLLNSKTNYFVFSFDPLLDVIQKCDYSQRREVIEKNSYRIERLYDRLADNRSKKTLKCVVGGGITSDILMYKDLSYEMQYFPDCVIERLPSNGTYIDVGAYDGDTVEEIIKATNDSFGRIICFEPDPYNYVALCEKFKDDKRIIPIRKGVGKNKTKLYVVNESNGLDEGAYLTNDETECYVDVVSLDEELKDVIPTFIKMDIEGLEADAINGARRIISAYHPDLAISVYHKCDDLFVIPELIDSIYSGYKFYLRHYWETTGTDTILFALNCNKKEI